MTGLIPRLARPRLDEQLRSFRAVVVNGPRQAGKSTLLHMHTKEHGGTYRSLDDPQWLTAATDDPTTFVSTGDRPLRIDEVQRGGNDLVLAVKAAVDRSREKGQFVLSGSSNFLTVPSLSESLAGRVGFVETWPFTVSERTGAPPDFCDLAFEDPRSLLRAPTSPWTRSDYLALICSGGYPEAVELREARARRQWFDSYLRSVVTRDVRSFARLQHATRVPRLLELVAARAGSITVVADVARSLEISTETARTYLGYLGIVYLTVDLPAWSTNLTTKAARTPKTYVSDPGLAAHVVRVNADGLQRPGHPALGGLTETFAATELIRLRGAASTAFDLHYFRDRDGREIDFVLESWDGRVVAIEVKASATPKSADARHLRWLRDKLGDRMRGGIVLHLGENAISLGDDIVAVPLSALWSHRRLDSGTS
ncbi:ATP-binding protein [Jiangella mangrovi]|uniref:Putative AAA+ superfamily ATPase n=1 Tax=Jiangella mangrovi TaxID=1524084 RepID=A0A7W9GPG3_9ACTN|nr:ATP-binding protein [Jiangella mangrovi]MBB5787623.1 putative AAA+ superfamily ATPase [Jiangella mangrovi]